LRKGGTVIYVVLVVIAVILLGALLAIRKRA
jgi:hypothetical protein